MKILVFHRRLSGYYIACLSRLLEADVTAQIVAWPNQKDAPFGAGVSSVLGEVANRDDLSEAELLAMALEFKPDAVLVAGWSDAGYVKVCRVLKARGVLIVSGCDTQWKGSLRQHVASVVAPWHVQKIIDVFWVSGERQRQLVAKLGYSGDRCWDGVYACDWQRFADAEVNDRRTEDPAFLFVGRYVDVKGIDTLAQAYQRYCGLVEHPWRLICAGAGPLRDSLLQAGADDRGFVQPADLPALMAEASALVLPSRFEPWGVVVQEAAASALPLICSDACGAGVHLLRDRWNGRSFAAGDAAHLADCLLWMHQQSDAQLATLGRNSFELSKQYTPDRWAQTLLQGVRGQRAED